MQTIYLTVSIPEYKLHDTAASSKRRRRRKYPRAGFFALCSMLSALCVIISTVLLLISVSSARAQPQIQMTRPQRDEAADPLHLSTIVLKPDLDLEAQAAEKAAESASSLPVPAVDTSFKAYMSYRAITAKNSIQYRIQHSDAVWTDEFGFRRYGDYYLVALGTYYSQHAGETFQITLEDGTSFLAMTRDIKSDRDTDSLHQVHIVNGTANLIEFLVDTDQIPSKCRKSGDMGDANNGAFSASVTSIEKLSEVFS